jgi:hypothetical protein
MELSKEQIQYIDHRLENDGVKYWEIRIEMLDHIVSDVEKNLQPENTEYQFKEIVQDAFVSLGWKENFNGSNFPNNDKDTFKNVNNEYRKMYHQGFINFFKSFKNIGILITFLLIFYTFSNTVNFKIFKRISLVLFILPIVLILFYSIKIWLKQYGKSIHLNYGSFYFSFAFFMINLPVQFLKEFSESNQQWFLIIALPLYFIFTYSGYQVYKRSIKEAEQMRKELLS